MGIVVMSPAYADRTVEELKKRIEDYAEANKYTVDGTILGIVLETGSCPCRLGKVECPCTYAPDEIEKTGRCYCGLLRKDL